jgi:transcription-repair coupling factor (superfamily II helicase)
MNLSSLLKLFDQIPAYSAFADAIHWDELTPNLRRPLGVLTAARPALLAALLADIQRPILFITARADRARIFAEQIQCWATDPSYVYRFPDPDALPHEKVSWGGETIRGRLATLSALITYNNSIDSPNGANNQVTNRPPPLIVASARGLMHHTLPPTEFTILEFRIGQRIRLDDVLRQWISLGYQAEDVVEVPGSFSRRGGILDVYPANTNYPVRIELFGDEIDSLRSFDPSSQRSERRMKRFTLGPATETLPRVGAQAASRLQRWNFADLQTSSRAVFEEDTARLGQGTSFRGIEYYLPFFYNNNGSHDRVQATSIMDYLPANALVIIEDPDVLAGVVDELEIQARTLKQDLVNLGDLPEGWPDPYSGWAELAPKLAARNPLILGFTHLAAANQTATTGTEALNPTYYFQDVFHPGPAYGGQVKNVLPEIVKRKKRGERVVLVSRQSARLSHLLGEFAPDAAIAPVESLNPDDPPPPQGSITLLHGMLIEGWTVRSASESGQSLITVMSDSELFGWKKPTTTRKPRPRKGVTPETFFADVNPGDLVVHIEHGIGRYMGLIKLDFEGVQREYLAVEYSNKDKLYVPIHQADRLARYVGIDDGIPKLNRLGSADWNTVKRRTKKAVEDIAKELLEVYAKREVSEGHAFSEDTEWQREVEDSFPFVETDDQLRAIADVKADMERPKIMDRLICGDVGYGKTEVALRAAFKAVMDGFQAAVLAPTTILAQQHWQTFTERLSAYPIQIEMLSRFRTKSQQDRTLGHLAEGVCDIVIGTHRLLQKDVAFKNLGLLIIDEEQRFGVKQKERLKTLRTEIDVLTLTATPIPRTLHMSLSGVRDLSTIDTPPEERLPVQTVVTEYDETLIRQAVLREMDRGGQVFYVYNRVMGIEQKANRIRNLLPEANVVVGHGQMSERQLERAMVTFVSGEADVLVATTIIENGLDMPNVNTIIIDRADWLGLSQMYQLRGRVGRGAVQAYAYLLTPKHYQLNIDARRRLDAIAEASDLGAGFRIAMRDLEIRGAGELLGARQHGNISAVGFDLYTRLLAQAIREIKGESVSSVLKDEATAYLNPLADGIQLNLPLPAYVPEDYLPEEKLRFRLYRRLAGISTLSGIDDMARELEDRFGDLPEPVANLLYQLRLKWLGMEAGVKSIITETGQIIIRADTLEFVDRPGLERRLSAAAKVTPRQVTLPLHPSPEVWQAELEKTLRLITRMVHDPAR